MLLQIGFKPPPPAEMVEAPPVKRARRRYLMLRLQVLWTLLIQRKLTAQKLWNAFHCYAAYALKLPTSARSPLLMSFELWNECNEACVFCRNAKGIIPDMDPQNPSGVISKGQMEVDVYKRIIDEVKDRIVLAIPYINGEPLIYKHINEVIRYSSERGVATMIATNGILLSEERGRELLQAGIDFIKIHISGFTQTVHSVQHRRGDVERIKRNIRTLVDLRNRGGYRTFVLLDYIVYKHNRHEVELARQFADSLGIGFNLRPGNPRGMEESEDPLVGAASIGKPCDLLWKMMSVNWDGSMLPCCDYVLWNAQEHYGQYVAGDTSIEKVWNGERVRRMRQSHAKKGRREYRICEGCPRDGIAFKY